MKTPGIVGPSFQVDEDRKQNVEVPEHALPDVYGVVVHDEHDRGAQGLDLIALSEHLHEVRTADQSAGMPKKADEHRCAAEVLEIEGGALKRGQCEARRHPS